MRICRAGPFPSHLWSHPHPPTPAPSPGGSHCFCAHCLERKEALRLHSHGQVTDGLGSGIGSD